MNELYPFINSYVFPALSLFDKIVWTNESEDWPLERVIGCASKNELKTMLKRQTKGRVFNFRGLKYYL